jgi:isochorismate synthase
VLHSDYRRTLSGFGELREIPLPTLRQISSGVDFLSELSTIELTGSSGPSDSLPRCHVAFPFNPEGQGRAVIPSFQVTESDGGTWLCVLGTSESDLDALEAEALALLRASTPPRIDTPVIVKRLTEHPTTEGYAARVADAVTRIRAGDLLKVVLARSIDLDAAAELDPAAVLQRMAEREPACTRYAFPGPMHGRLVGASPELLIAREGSKISSHPLAGTLSLRSAHDDVSELLRSEKDLDEHRLVVENLAESLRPLLQSLSVPEGPSLVTLRSVAHLGTLLTGTVPTDGSAPRLLELLAALHPTPAVGGVPRNEALQVIQELEGDRRNFFAGGIGWCNVQGDGEWVLGIRGALLDGTHCEFTAGAGIVADSTPCGEADETRSKLASVLEAVAPGSSTALEVVTERLASTSFHEGDSLPTS